MTPDTESAISMALEAGFSHAAALNPAELVFMPEVREMCAADRCRSYGRSWACPPAVGTLEQLEARCRAYGRGVLVQTVGEREDEFDLDGIMAAEARHSKNLRALVLALRERGADMLPLGAGTCSLCTSCSYPDAPCRRPELVFPSMEACGLMVSDVCEKCGLPYYYGRLSICFVSCVLLG